MVVYRSANVNGRETTADVYCSREGDWTGNWWKKLWSAEMVRELRVCCYDHSRDQKVNDGFVLGVLNGTKRLLVVWIAWMYWNLVESNIRRGFALMLAAGGSWEMDGHGGLKDCSYLDTKLWSVELLWSSRNQQYNNYFKPWKQSVEEELWSGWYCARICGDCWSARLNGQKMVLELNGPNGLGLAKVARFYESRRSTYMNEQKVRGFWQQSCVFGTDEQKQKERS